MKVNPLYEQRIAALENRATERLQAKASWQLAKTVGQRSIVQARPALSDDGRCISFIDKVDPYKTEVGPLTNSSCNNSSSALKVPDKQFRVMQRIVAKFESMEVRAKIRVIGRELRRHDMVSDAYHAFLVDRQNQYKDQLLKMHIDAIGRRAAQGTSHFVGWHFVGCAR